ncbi:MAG: 3-isopropylmalate dehydratase small subunit [Sphingomicrobium sp.]
MIPLTLVEGNAATLPLANIDTDIIFPARFLLITEKRGLGQYAFHDRADLAVAAGTEILVTGDNFGCGSSREQAPWALADLGVRVLIATGFGEIFQSNCFKNGMLPIVLDAQSVATLDAAAKAGEPFTVDLEAQEICLPQTGTFAFTVEAARREALLNGWDEIARIRAGFGDAIAAFEHRQRIHAPWLWTAEQGNLNG